MVICISGDYRSGKSGFSSSLADTVNLQHYSMRKLMEIEKTKYNTDFIDWNNKISDEDNKRIDSFIIDIARNSNCILDFRFASILCYMNQIDYIGIWISASIESRVYGNSYFWKKTESETKKIINNREEKEEETSKKLYGISYRNDYLYHYHFDLSKYWYPVEDVVRRGLMIKDEIDFIKNSEFKAEEQ